ncbi:Transcriptional regulator [Beijerinckiaceae bacterium RH AL1]|nr:helix-turn-helix domain-containing protein [Beijerinckiaceae bacterium]VVB46097.1 Transcriptional regulator [Beijerinckiaceae bacterium RH CH11]VVB46179.1 Transcriptional regulator [Beijerinckiaceae bacterium RH AL8]VVC55201.1 Transcriptional regulator [Beijerinckiaceae bacterium RH AL1]
MTSPETELPEAQSRAIAQAVREALARRRISRQKLADDARISVSTLEKALSGRRPFTLATTIRLEEALGASLRGPASTAAPLPARNAPEALGAYSHEAVAWLEGRYLTLRPSFGATDAIFAYRTELLWDEAESCLAFREAERIDAPFAQSGQVSVPHQSGAIYLVTQWHGQYRLAMLGRPTIFGEMYGVLTTLQPGRGGALTPVAAPLALIPEARLTGAMPYGRITSGMPEFAACRAMLARVGEEGYATFFTCPG